MWRSEGLKTTPWSSKALKLKVLHFIWTSEGSVNVDALHAQVFTCLGDRTSVVGEDWHIIASLTSMWTKAREISGNTGHAEALTSTQQYRHEVRWWMAKRASPQPGPTLRLILVRSVLAPPPHTHTHHHVLVKHGCNGATHSSRRQ